MVLLGLPCSAALFAHLAVAAPAQMVKDIAPPEQREPALIREIVPLSNGKVFVGYFHNEPTGDLGRHETWIYDRSSGQYTRFTKDDVPSPFAFVSHAVGNTLYFGVAPLGRESGLWKTDGTAEGTRKVHALGGRTAYGIHDVEGILYFFTPESGDRNQPWQRVQLWRSDGTDAGTQMLKTIPTPIYIGLTLRWGIGANGQFYFFGYDPEAGMQLWRSDGTGDGTKPIKKFFPEESGWVGTLADSGDKLFFSLPASGCVDGVCSTSDEVLWVSDGTDSGTQSVKTFFGTETGLWGHIDSGMILEGKYFFSARDAGSDVQLWASDGTAAGTVPLGTPADNLVLFNDAVFSGFTQRYPVDESVTRGPAAGPTTFRSLPQAIGGQIFLADWDGTLWASDGTQESIRELLRAPDHGGEYVETITAVEGQAFFSVEQRQTDFAELWTSDGTANNTTVLSRKGPAGSSHPIGLVDGNGKMYFSAYDAAGNRRLWSSDGSDSGTVLASIVPSATTPVFESPLVQLGQRILYLAGSYDWGGTLWASDGTESGTESLEVHLDSRRATTAAAVLKDALYFAGERHDDSTARSVDDGLWRSDGTVEGTQLVVPYSSTGVYSASNFFAAGNKLFFTNTEDELWVTDGTAAGTQFVKRFDDEFSINLLSPSRRATLGDTLYFLAQHADSNVGLWRSDGTEAGTVLVKDFNPGGTALVNTLITVDQQIYLSVSDGETTQLWRSDGTSSGTTVTQVDSPNGLLGALNGRLLFSHPEATSSEQGRVTLSITDGTLTGTQALRSFTYIDSDSALAMQDVLYFRANDGSHGLELWQTDGTPDGTMMVQDIAHGVASSDPDELAVAGNKLFFVADDSVNGRELWVLPTEQGGSGGVVALWSLLLLTFLGLFQHGSRAGSRRRDA